jgi:hypothetical protein
MSSSPLVVELDLEEVLDVHLGHVVHDLPRGDDDTTREEGV